MSLTCLFLPFFTESLGKLFKKTDAKNACSSLLRNRYHSFFLGTAARELFMMAKNLAKNSWRQNHREMVHVWNIFTIIAAGKMYDTLFPTSYHEFNLNHYKSPPWGPFWPGKTMNSLSPLKNIAFNCHSWVNFGDSSSLSWRLTSISAGYKNSAAFLRLPDVSFSAFRCCNSASSFADGMISVKTIVLLG